VVPSCGQAQCRDEVLNVWSDPGSDPVSDPVSLPSVGLRSDSVVLVSRDISDLVHVTLCLEALFTCQILVRHMWY